MVPIATARARLPTWSCHQVIDSRLMIRSATALPSTAGTADARVIQKRYVTGVASTKASMPMKCIAQIPVPRTPAPAQSQSHRVPRLRDTAIRSTTAHAAKAARMATEKERTTREM